MEKLITVRIKDGVVQSLEGIPLGVRIRIADLNVEQMDESVLTTLEDGRATGSSLRRFGCSALESMLTQWHGSSCRTVSSLR